MSLSPLQKSKSSAHVITEGQCHRSDQTPLEKILMRREGVARGPWRATYWNQTFSHQADTTLLLLLSGDKSTSCSWQSQIPSFAPLQVAIKRPPKLFQFVGKQEMRRPCTIHSPSFTMTDNFSCKSFKSWATVTLKIGGWGWGGGVNDPQLTKT